MNNVDERNIFKALPLNTVVLLIKTFLWMTKYQIPFERQSNQLKKFVI